MATGSHAYSIATGVRNGSLQEREVFFEMLKWGNRCPTCTAPTLVARVAVTVVAVTMVAVGIVVSPCQCVDIVVYEQTTDSSVDMVSAPG
jgi:hypothetical protein